MARSDYTHKIVNGERIKLTEDEIDEAVKLEEEWEAGKAERALVAIRRERDARLADTDFYALADVNLVDDMKTYRQALRDVPKDNADPVKFQTQWYEFNAKKSGVADPWPTKP